MPGYIYRGTGIDVLEAVQHCGTNRGYNQHKRNNEPVDEACRKAHNEYETRQKENRARGPKFQQIEHGTYRGYRQEVRRKMKTCERCKKANAEHTAKLTARSR